MSDKHKYFEPRMHKQALQAECCRLHDQRDQLREALQEILAYGDGCNLCMDCQINQSDEWDKARAALKATEEG